MRTGIRGMLSEILLLDDDDGETSRGWRHLRFGKEVYPNSGLIVPIKIVIHEACNDTGLPNTLVAQKY